MSHSETNYNYKDNKILSVSYNGQDDKSYKYVDGLKVQEISNLNKDEISFVGITNFKYNENKDLILKIDYSEMISSSIKFESKFESKFENNKIISMCHYVKENNTYNLSDSAIYKYDSYGNLINMSNFILSDGRVNNTSYSYEFDKSGNWIKKTDNNGIISTRQIIYFGDNSDDILAKFETTKNRLKSGQQSSESIGNHDANINSTTNSNSNYNQQQPQNQSNKSKCSHCSGTGQCPKCTVPQRVRFKQGETPNDHYEKRFGMIVCTQCGGNCMNFGTDKNKECYLCKGSGWLTCPECGHWDKEMIGKCKDCRGTGFRK